MKIEKIRCNKNFVMKKITLFVSLLVLGACSSPECNNTYPVFDNYKPDTENYKTELAKQLDNNSSGFSYKFESYSQTNDSINIEVSVNRKDLCAKASVLVTEPDEAIQGLLNTKGMGYRGAELSGLEIKTVEKNDKIYFIYKTLDRVID